jgi:hypothetical protein
MAHSVGAAWRDGQVGVEVSLDPKRIVNLAGVWKNLDAEAGPQYIEFANNVSDVKRVTHSSKYEDNLYRFI